MQNIYIRNANPDTHDYVKYKRKANFIRGTHKKNNTN